MTTTEFQAEFLSHAVAPKVDSPQDIIADFAEKRAAALAQAAELGISKEGAIEVRHKFARAFVRRWMMLKFAAIDPSFTARKWWLRVERDGVDGVKLVDATDAKPAGEVDPVTTLVAQAPRFFVAEADADDVAFDSESLKVGNIEIGGLSAGRRKDGHYRSRSISVSAQLPEGLTPKHFWLCREALAHLQMAVALATAEGIGLQSDLQQDDYSRRDQRPKIRMLWAPNKEALSVTATPPRPKGDPAIIFAVAGHSFLLDFFDTPNEESITHLIREFSEGKLR